jgi:hypothetical protein
VAGWAAAARAPKAKLPHGTQCTSHSSQVSGGGGGGSARRGVIEHSSRCCIAAGAKPAVTQRELNILAALIAAGL